MSGLLSTYDKINDDELDPFTSALWVGLGFRGVHAAADHVHGLTSILHDVAGWNTFVYIIEGECRACYRTLLSRAWH
jgi:hypothetical protein